jgi:polar amino acid transport system substrate-binding protein
MKARYNRAYRKLVAEGIYPRLMEKHAIRVDFTMTEDDQKKFDAAQRRAE